MKRRIAYVEDDTVIRENYTDLLEGVGFAVEAYATRAAAAEGIRKSLPDVVLLDITLGDENDAGFQLCGDIRRISATVPIVFLTSHDGEIDKISGLRLGADDYITKDSSIDFIIARLEALLRRIRALTTERVATPSDTRFVQYPGSGLRLDSERCEATWKNQKLGITLTQYWMLASLYREPGKIQSVNALMQSAKIAVEPNTVVAHIKAIRDAIRRVDPSFDGIRTERAKGYRWVESV